MALYMMADALKRGNGVPINPPKAMSIYHRAAEKGSLAAAHQLGMIYGFHYSIYDVDQSEAEAVSYFEFAANNGFLAS